MEQEDNGTIGVVVVAAGRGERAGTSVEGPKQYRRIGGRPVLWHTLNGFLDWPKTGPIIVVIHPDDRVFYDAVTADIAGRAKIAVVTGGATRQISVLRGLQALADAGVGHVMIHDGVRPFCSTGWKPRYARAPEPCCRRCLSQTRSSAQMAADAWSEQSRAKISSRRRHHSLSTSKLSSRPMKKRQ